MNTLQNIFDRQLEFEQYLSDTVKQIAVPDSSPTHIHVIEAIYYFQCLNVEFYEFLNTENRDDLLEELIDVLIFAIDTFLFLGVKPEHLKKDINDYYKLADSTSMKIVKDSCYANNFITVLLNSKYSVAEDYVTHILATLNVVFSRLLYNDVAYKKWKKHDSTLNIVKNHEAVVSTMDGILQLIFVLFKTAGFTVDDIITSYNNKIDKNMYRQLSGY